MKKFTISCVLVLIANFAVMVWFMERRDLIKQMISMAALCGVAVLALVSFFIGVGRYRREKFRAFIPWSVLVVGLPVSFIGAGWLGGSIKEARFERNLPRYNEVVRRILAGELKADPADYDHIHLPPAFADLAWVARAGTNSDGQTVEFFVEGGFPVAHSGYLYVSAGKMTDVHMLGDWPIHQRIGTNWFYVSD